MDTKFIFENNTTYTDFTVEVNDYYNNNANTIDVVNADDYIYIGSRLPFNHLYFKFGTANTASATLALSVWDGNTWTAAVQLYDETETGGATFGQDGYISWVPDRSEGWGREDTQDSAGNELVTGLGSVNIYDHYWIRLLPSADLDAGTTIAWVGPLFGDDNDLGSEYPDLTLSGTMTAWESGKTSWEEQFVKASRYIVDDLKARNLIIHQSQILDRKDFTAACVSKVAEMAYRAMGPRFVEDRNDARMQYENRIGRQVGHLDSDRDGLLDNDELPNFQGKVYR